MISLGTNALMHFQSCHCSRRVPKKRSIERVRDYRRFTSFFCLLSFVLLLPCSLGPRQEIVGTSWRLPMDLPLFLRQCLWRIFACLLLASSVPLSIQWATRPLLSLLLPSPSYIRGTDLNKDSSKWMSGNTLVIAVANPPLIFLNIHLVDYLWKLTIGWEWQWVRERVSASDRRRRRGRDLVHKQRDSVHVVPGVRKEGIQPLSSYNLF